MFELDLPIRSILSLLRPARAEAAKKADVFEHSWVFEHVGLLFNQPPGATGLPFI
jgi:hypothetical protein